MIKNFYDNKTKEQASGIASEKILEICDMIPAMNKEIDWGKGKTNLNGKDYIKVVFKNGSRFDVVATKESSRGKMTKVLTFSF